MNMFRAAVMASLLIVPTLTFAQDVKIDFDKAFNFAPVKTYSIKVGTSWGNDLSERRVLAEIDQEIASKGWKKAPEASADVQVLLHGATQTKRTANTFYSGYGGYRYGGFGSSSTMVSEYTVGTLVVDIFDSRTKNLIYRAIAEDELSDNPEKNVKRLEKASTKMFKNFPPAAKK